MKKLTLAVGIILLLCAGWFYRPQVAAHPTIDLVAPSVPQPNNYLENEAGISAYTQLPTTVNFFYVRPLFHTIELETSDYIIGSIFAPGYGEGESVHVYIHQSGWVLAYYLRFDPTSKIVDWHAYDVVSISTKFEAVLELVASELQVTIPEIGYYHFQYPQATHLMLIADRNDSFEINVPGTFVYLESSWSLDGYMYTNVTANYYFDGALYASIEHSNCCYSAWVGPVYGVVGAMVPDVYHMIEITRGGNGTAYGGLVLVYNGGNE